MPSVSHPIDAAGGAVDRWLTRLNTPFVGYVGVALVVFALLLPELAPAIAHVFASCDFPSAFAILETIEAKARALLGALGAFGALLGRWKDFADDAAARAPATPPRAAAARPHDVAADVPPPTPRNDAVPILHVAGTAGGSTLMSFGSFIAREIKFAEAAIVGNVANLVSTHAGELEPLIEAEAPTAVSTIVAAVQKNDGILGVATAAFVNATISAYTPQLDAMITGLVAEGGSAATTLVGKVVSALQLLQKQLQAQALAL